MTGWDWTRFRGTVGGLKWARRDMEQNLESVLALVEGRKLAIQAGGHLGIFAKRLAQEFEAVYTFEPDPENFACLCANAPEPNIVKIQAALGMGKGRVAISKKRRDGKPVKHEGIRHVAGPGIIPQVRLDDFVFDEVDLIYLDVEGFELKALKGAFDTLTMHPARPVVVAEINRHIEFAGDSREALYAYMAKCGYEHYGGFNSDEVFVKGERMGARR